MQETKQGLPAETQVKAGYKKTKIGWIPEDWGFSMLESLTPKDTKYGIVDGPFGSNLKTIHYRKSGVPIITSGYVTDGVFYANEYLFVEDELFQREKRSSVKGGDIVMAKIGARCGASAILPKEHQIGILSGNALKISIDESRFSTYFIWIYLWQLHKTGKMEMLKTVGAQPAVSMSSLKKIRLPLPPLPEQQKIAQILSTWDKGITKLEQVISQKQLLKKGLMQQLLTGKKRFAGFIDKWKEVKLGKIGSFTKGKGISKAELVDEGVPAIRYGELYTNHHFVIKSFTSFISKETSKDCQRLEKGDLLFSGSGEKQFEIGKSAVFNSQVEAYAGGDIVIFKTKKANPIFLSYYLNSSLGIRQRGMYAQGHSVVHIYSRDLAKIKLSLPNLEEQDRIVTIFESLDQQIKQLKNQLTKLQEQKKGLMQKLLTGEVRVKI